MTIVLIIFIVEKGFSIVIIETRSIKPIQINLSIMHVVIFYFIIYANFCNWTCLG